MPRICANKDANGYYTDLNPSITTGAVTDLNVLDFATLETTGNLSYGFSSNPNLILGSRVLLQRFIKAMLTVKGSSAYDDNFGSYFFELFRSIDVASVNDIKAKIPLFMKNLAETIVKTDTEALANGMSIPLDEQLEDLTVESVNFDTTFNG